MWNRKMLAFLLAPIFPSIILLFIFGLTELKWILFCCYSQFRLPTLLFWRSAFH